MSLSPCRPRKYTYIHKKSAVLSNTRNSISSARHTFLDKNVQKHIKWIVKRRVWMSGCPFCRCRPRKLPIQTYIHGPVPSQRGTIFSCMFSFAHAGRGNGATHTNSWTLKPPQTDIQTSIHKWRVFKKVPICPWMFLFPRPWPRKRYIHGPMPFQSPKKVVEHSCMYFPSACMGKIPCIYVWMYTRFYMCMSVCRFDDV